MKTLALAFLLAGSFFAHAQTAYSLSAGFAVLKCTQVAANGASTQDCQPAPGYDAPQTMTFNLSSCTADSTGAKICSGNWSPNLVVDAFSFNGVVQVNQTTETNGTIAYAVISATFNPGFTTGPQQTLYPAGQGLTDSTVLVGDPWQNSADTSVTYMAAMIIGPTNSASPASMTTMKAAAVKRLENKSL